MRDWKRYVRKHLHLPGVGGDIETEIVEEIASQLHDCYMGAIANGASQEDAEMEAQNHITDWAALAADIVRSKRAVSGSNVSRRLEDSERALRVRGGHWIGIANLLQELRFSVRRLRKASGFTFVVLITLAVGIGANSAVFSLTNGILLQPLPYDEPDQLVGIWNTAPGLGMDLLVQSPAFHYTYEDEARVFEDLGLWSTGTVAVTGLAEATQNRVVWVTEGVFPTLRVQPLFGRTFTEVDDTPGTPETILLSARYWHSSFGSDPNVIGQTLRVDGLVREIIGVLPESFRIVDTDPAIYLPFRFDRSRMNVGNFSFRSVGRLRPGMTIEQATAELASLIPLSVEKFPGGITLDVLEEAQAAPLLHPLKDDFIGNVGNLLWILLGTAAIVLLIACANVANLSLVRAERQDREIAVRTALGASRGQLALQFIMESVSLGVVGGVFGLALAHAGLRVLVATAPENLPRLEEVAIDPVVLGFTAGISIFAGFLIGLLPIIRHREFSMVSALKEGGRGSGSGRERHRARNTLVVVQMALALVLLVGSGLMIRSFVALRNVDPGFRDPESVLTLRLTIPEAEVVDLEEMAGVHEQIARLIGEIPGVESVGLTSSVTMGIGNSNDPVYIEEFPLPEGQLPPMRQFKWVGEGYFETMKNPVIAGRAITWDDVHLRPPVVVVTENFAREYWGEPAAALGKRISTGNAPGDWREIIGVVGNVRDAGVAMDPSTIVYWPMLIDNPWDSPSDAALSSPRTLAYAIRSERAGTASLLREVRDAIWSVNRNLPLAHVRTLDTVLASSTASTSFTLIMLGIAAAVALILGTVGVYGVISYAVSQRTRELGIRIALGAQTQALMGMVLRQGVLLAGIGVALGLVASYAGTRLMSGLLFGVNPVDPLTYGAVAVALVAVALLAAYVPARRAARIDPTEALRME